MSALCIDKTEDNYAQLVDMMICCDTKQKGTMKLSRAFTFTFPPSVAHQAKLQQELTAEWIHLDTLTQYVHQNTTATTGEKYTRWNPFFLMNLMVRKDKL